MNKESFQETLMRSYHDQIRTLLISCTHTKSFDQSNSDIELSSKIKDLVNEARVDGLDEENIYLLLVIQKKGLEVFYQKEKRKAA